MNLSIEEYLQRIKTEHTRDHLLWNEHDDTILAYMAAHGRATGIIAWSLRRSEAAIYKRASHLGISLHPTNQSPYNRPA